MHESVPWAGGQQVMVRDQRGREDRDQGPGLVKLHRDTEAEASRGQGDQHIGEARP